MLNCCAIVGLSQCRAELFIKKKAWLTAILEEETTWLYNANKEYSNVKVSSD